MRHGTTGRLSAQQGAVLFIALIVLVAMSLAGLALMRSVDTGTLIAGNLAFKQGAVNAGDSGVEQARNFLMSPPTGVSLDNDSMNYGYYATDQSGYDLLGVDPSKTPFPWSDSTKIMDGGTDAAGNHLQYVIHRMCESVGQVAGINCVRAANVAGASMSKGGVNYNSYGLSSSATVYFRVTVKVTGPRNTVSYVQAMMY